MERVHDMGGQTRFSGPLPPIDPDEPALPEAWEAKTFALALLANRVAGANLHAFRYALERVPEEEYLSGYYHRWLASAEILLLDSGILAPGAVEARAHRLQGEDVEEPAVPEPHKPSMPSGGGGNLRAVETPPAFAVGDAVTTRAGGGRGRGPRAAGGGRRGAGRPRAAQAVDAQRRRGQPAGRRDAAGVRGRRRGDDPRRRARAAHPAAGLRPRQARHRRRTPAG